MDKIKYPKPIDLKSFERHQENPNTLYGLPEEVIYCKNALFPIRRPNSAVEYKHTKGSKKVTINFDKNGVCDACNFAEKKRHSIDWNERDRELKELCDKYRKNDGSYDCIVPGSGGKDSFCFSHSKTQIWDASSDCDMGSTYTDWGWKNFQKWIHAGHDNNLITPNGRVHRLLTRLSTELLFHPFQAFMFG